MLQTYRTHIDFCYRPATGAAQAAGKTADHAAAEAQGASADILEYTDRAIRSLCLSFGPLQTAVQAVSETADQAEEECRV